MGGTLHPGEEPWGETADPPSRGVDPGVVPCTQGRNHGVKPQTLHPGGWIQISCSGGSRIQVTGGGVKPGTLHAGGGTRSAPVVDPGHVYGRWNPPSRIQTSPSGGSRIQVMGGGEPGTLHPGGGSRSAPVVDPGDMLGVEPSIKNPDQSQRGVQDARTVCVPGPGDIHMHPWGGA